MNRDAIFGRLECRVDSRGRFCLRGLEEGDYELTYYGDSYARDMVIDFENKSEADQFHMRRVALNSGQQLDGIRLKIPQTGTAALSGRGFARGDHRRLAGSATRVGSGTDNPPLTLRILEGMIRSDGSLDYSIKLAAGTWKLSLSLSSSVPVERIVEIKAGELARLKINRDEFAVNHGVTAVSGSITLSHGAPIAGAWLSLTRHNPSGDPDQHGNHNCRTDSNGSFAVEGVRPGLWKTVLNVRDRSRRQSSYSLFLDNLVIPADPQTRTRLDIRLPDNKLRAVLYSEEMNRSLLEEDGRVTVSVKEADSGRTLMQFSGLIGSKLEMAYLPAVDLYFEIALKGSLLHRSEIYPMAEGQIRDLGTVLLSRRK